MKQSIVILDLEDVVVPELWIPQTGTSKSRIGIKSQIEIQLDETAERLDNHRAGNRNFFS